MAKTKTKSSATKTSSKNVKTLSSKKGKVVNKKSAGKKKVQISKKKSKLIPKKSSVVMKKIKLKKIVNLKSPVKKEKTGRSEVSVKIDIIEKKIKRFKPNKKTRYTKAELKHFRDIILQERKAIFESAKANMDALVDKDGEYKGDNLTYSSHMAEQGTDEMEREKNYLFVQRDEKYLGYLQDALMRIDQGTYGICVDCRDEPKNLCRTCPLIVKERLELVPITQHCIECKNLRG